jgi:hypothetical protein
VPARRATPLPPPPSPLPPRAKFSHKKLTKETELFLASISTPRSPCTRNLERTRRRGFHREGGTAPWRPTRSFGWAVIRNRAHTQAMMLGLLNKSQQNRATALSSCQITAKRFVGPQNLPDQLMGCSGLCPLDSINLNISTERAQGHLLSFWSKSGALHTNNPRYSLCAHPYGSSKPTDSVSKSSLSLS